MEKDVSCVWLVSLFSLLWLCYLCTDPSLNRFLIATKIPFVLVSSEGDPDLEETRTWVSGKVSTSRATRILSQECYHYSGLTADNTCCRLLDYAKDDGKNILECAVRTSSISLADDSEIHQQKSINKSQIPVDESLNRTLKGIRSSASGHWIPRTGQYWVFIGDSHMRMAFDQLITFCANATERFQHFKLLQGKWIQVGQENFTRVSQIEQARNVKHLDIPLHMSYYKDLFLTQLPVRIRDWVQQPHLAPNLLVTGGALHFMVNTSTLYHTHGAEVAANEYEKVLRKLVPKLGALAGVTNVVFKLQDHIPVSGRNIPIFLGENIDRYNSIARRVLQGTSVILWDNTIPLSDAYLQHCQIPQLHPRNTPDRTWCCNDDRHVGYVVIKHYINMLLNFMCNRYLTNENEYCL